MGQFRKLGSNGISSWYKRPPFYALLFFPIVFGFQNCSSPSSTSQVKAQASTTNNEGLQSTSSSSTATVSATATSPATASSPASNSTPTATIGPVIPLTAQRVMGIQNLAGWGPCNRTDTSSAGELACLNVKSLPPLRSLTQSLSSPSMDGKTAEFTIGGGTYPGWMWNNHLNTNTAKNFVMEMYLSAKNAPNIHAIELALLKSDGGNWYKFSTQCNPKSGWRMIQLKPSIHWVSLGMPCSLPKAGTWQHVLFEFSVKNSQTSVDALWIDGVRTVVNMQMPPGKASGDNMGVHMQLDGDATGSAYSIEVDGWNIYYW